MKIDKYVDDGKTTFSIDGRLDASTTPELQEELIPEFESSKKITLDFKHLVYISSAGLRVLMIAVKKSMATGVEFSATNVPSEIMKIFDMTMLSSYLKIT